MSRKKPLNERCRKGLSPAVTTFAELAFTYLFARRYVRELRDDAPADSAMTQFRFTMPLALGGFLLAAAPFMVATFVGRTADHVAMLSIHYVTIGLANAIGYAALRMQAVTIQFPPEYDGDRRVLRYAVLAATLHFGLPGWLMGVTAILSATVATTVAVRAHLAVTRAANSALAGRR